MAAAAAAVAVAVPTAAAPSILGSLTSAVTRTAAGWGGPSTSPPSPPPPRRRRCLIRLLGTVVDTRTMTEPSTGRVVGDGDTLALGDTGASLTVATSSTTSLAAPAAALAFVAFAEGEGNGTSITKEAARGPLATASERVSTWRGTPAAPRCARARRADNSSAAAASSPRRVASTRSSGTADPAVAAAAAASSAAAEAASAAASATSARLRRRRRGGALGIGPIGGRDAVPGGRGCENNDTVGDLEGVAVRLPPTTISMRPPISLTVSDSPP